MVRNWIQLTQICINMCCTYMEAMSKFLCVGGRLYLCGSGSSMCTVCTDIYWTLCFGMFARGWISNPNNSIYTRGVMLYQNRKLNLHRMYHTSRSCCRARYYCSHVCMIGIYRLVGPSWPGSVSIFREWCFLFYYSRFF